MKTERGFTPVIILVGILIAALTVGGGYYFFKVKTPTQKACTLEAKICPDGTGVGRSGPNCEFASCPSLKDSDFEEVTIKQLFENRDKYNGKKVKVKGEYRVLSGRARPMVECMPSGNGKNPQIIESNIITTTWGISDGLNELGVDAIDQSGVRNSTLPNYNKGQEIQLEGLARTSIVNNDCNLDIRYKVIYLEVKAEDIDITVKPPLDTLPSLK